MMNRLFQLIDYRWTAMGAIGLWLVSSVFLYTSGPFHQLSQQSDGFVFFDMRCDYSNEQAVQSMASTDEVTKRLYAKHLVLDTLFVIVQSLAVTFLLLFAIRKRGGADSKLQWLCLPVLLIGLVDIAENIGIGLMLTTHAGNTPVLIEMTRSITATKFALLFFLPASLILAIALLLWPAIRRCRLFGNEHPQSAGSLP